MSGKNQLHAVVAPALGVARYFLLSLPSHSKMGKSSCAVRCTNRFKKGSAINFYQFPNNPDRRRKVDGTREKKPLGTKQALLAV